MSQSGGIVSDFSDLSDGEFYRTAADYLKARDALDGLLKQLDNEIRGVCREFGNREKTWGVGPIILRRELKLRGYGV